MVTGCWWRGAYLVPGISNHRDDTVKFAGSDHCSYNTPGIEKFTSGEQAARTDQQHKINFSMTMRDGDCSKNGANG